MMIVEDQVQVRLSQRNLERMPLAFTELGELEE